MPFLSIYCSMEHGHLSTVLLIFDECAIRETVGRVALPTPTMSDACAGQFVAAALGCVASLLAIITGCAHHDEQKTHRSSVYVILSERSESKDLRTFGIFAVKSVRRSFDSGLCPPLRMTDTWCIDSFMTMTEVDEAWVSCFGWTINQLGRRGQCRPPYRCYCEKNKKKNHTEWCGFLFGRG